MPSARRTGCRQPSRCTWRGQRASITGRATRDRASAETLVAGRGINLPLVGHRGIEDVRRLPAPRSGPADEGGRSPRPASGEDLPARLEAIELARRVLVHGMVALRNLDRLVLAAERRREVALPGVGGDGVDGGGRGMPARPLERRRPIAAARDAAEDAFLPRQPARRLDALDGGGRDDAGQQRDVEVLRHEAVADPLDTVMSPFPACEEGALRRLHRVELDARIALAQVAADARERATAALRVHEGTDRAFRLLPDFGSGCEEVGLDIVRVVELAGHSVPVRVSAANLLEVQEGQVDIALAAGREDQPGAVGAHDLLPLVAHALGHDDRAGVALDGGDPRAGDAGIAGGALEHAHPGAKGAAALRPLEHVQIDAVLEAAGGPVPLDLDVNGRLDVGSDAAEPDQRSVPHGVGDGGKGPGVAAPVGAHAELSVGGAHSAGNTSLAIRSTWSCW